MGHITYQYGPYCSPATYTSPKEGSRTRLNGWLLRPCFLHLGSKFYIFIEIVFVTSQP